jgi:hypothetical protein
MAGRDGLWAWAVTALLAGAIVACGQGDGARSDDDDTTGSGASSGSGGAGGSTSTGGSTSSGGSTGDGGGGSAPIQGSDGCGMAQEAGFPCFDVTFGGAERQYCVDVRDGYDPSVPQAIVLGLHGCGGSPQGAHNNTDPQVVAGAGRYLFVYPKALESCWDTVGSVDVPFIEHVLDEVASSYCVQPDRVFADGMSSGGMMTSRLLCDGIALGGAAISLNHSCSLPRTVWLYGGTNDEYYDSYILPGRDGWIAVNGCASTTQPLPSGPCVEYDGCTHRTIWCSDTQGHVWPSDPYTAQIIDLFDSVP